jgi:type VI secretion system secreted protein Hcp
MAFDSFIQIDGVTGECTEADHANWIEINSFSLGLTQTARAVKSAGSGGAQAKADFDGFTFTTLMDQAYPQLMNNCATGKHIPNITVDMCRAAGDGQKVKYMEYKMTDCIINGVNVNTGGDFPTISVSVSFGTIYWTYQPQKSNDGSNSGNFPGGFNLETCKPM